MATRPKKKQTGRAGRVAFATLVILAVLSLAFFLVLRTQDETSIAENTLGTLLSPIQNAVSGVTIYVRDVFNGAKDYFRMSENLEASKREVTELKLQLFEYQEAVYENERLKTLLDMKQRFEQQDPVAARLISRAPGTNYDTFSVNKGTRDGVGVGMAVITGDGLVGRVFEVGLTYAKVMSIIDPRSSVACLIGRTRNNGIMYGGTSLGAETPECRMEYLPAVNDVASGDVVITSGSDSYFPKGIKVGEVTKVSRQQSDTADRFILVNPSVDFLRVEEVLILRTPVEKAEDRPLPELPTPTPKPTPDVEPTPLPTADPNALDPGLEQPWHYPSGQLTEDGELIEDMANTPSTGTVQDLDDLPEDEWAG